MKKIAIAGLACAGKTSVYEHMLSKDKRIKRIKFAKPHYDVLDVLGVPKHRFFMQEFSDLAKKHFGQDIFVKAYDNYVNKFEAADKNCLLVCDDMRYQIEFDYCKSNDWYLIYVDADEKLRKKRSDALGLEWKPHHNSEQCHLFYHKCDIIIKNNTTLDELKGIVDMIQPSITRGI